MFPKKNIPIKNEEKKDENLNINNEKEEEKPEERKNRNELDIKTKIRLRSTPARHNIPQKKSYKIRRAIIYKKQKKDK